MQYGMGIIIRATRHSALFLALCVLVSKGGTSHPSQPSAMPLDCRAVQQCAQSNMKEYYLTLMSNVPLITTRYGKGLYCHSGIHHAPPTPFKVGKGSDGVQDGQLETIDIADLVVHVDSCSVLKPIVQASTRRFRERYQKGPLSVRIALVPIDLVHLIEVVVGVRIVEPVPEERGKDDLNGRESHSLHLGEGPRVSQYNAFRIDSQNPCVNAGESRTEFFPKLFRDLPSLFGKVETIIAFAPGFSISRQPESRAQAVHVSRGFVLVVMEIFAKDEISQSTPVANLDPVVAIVPNKVQQRSRLQRGSSHGLDDVGFVIDDNLGNVFDRHR
mmetsp:Transcript_22667/g.63077  ORF Transcript_22667/g.63077 Transcript_22667/m.63077 type:complete len:329 (+) Transcript_22667:1233-2219(+)